MLILPPPSAQPGAGITDICHFAWGSPSVDFSKQLHSFLAHFPLNLSSFSPPLWAFRTFLYPLTGFITLVPLPLFFFSLTITKSVCASRRTSIPEAKISGSLWVRDHSGLQSEF